MGYENDFHENDKPKMIRVQVPLEPSAVFYEGEYEQYMFEMIAELQKAEIRNKGLVIPPGLGVRYLLDFFEETARLMTVEDYDNDNDLMDNPLDQLEDDNEKGEP